LIGKSGGSGNACQARNGDERRTAASGTFARLCI